jgi:AbrB family looped-hinge helix DNA binding protein
MTIADPTSTVVSTKGQVILPKAVRAEKHWDAGTRLIVENTPDGVLLKQALAFAPSRIEDVFASLPWTDAPTSIEAMDAAVLAEAKRRHARD